MSYSFRRSFPDISGDWNLRSVKYGEVTTVTGCKVSKYFKASNGQAYQHKETAFVFPLNTAQTGASQRPSVKQPRGRGEGPGTSARNKETTFTYYVFDFWVILTNLIGLL